MSGRKESPAVLREIIPTPPALKEQSPAPSQLSLHLPAGRHRLSASPKLWLCIYLPALPLEALSDDDAPLAQAVFEDHQGMRRVLLASGEALAAGIVPGLSVNAALALLPALRLLERDTVRERQALKKLAGWAEQFTSLVSVETPAMLLLEIAGSLRLFGGLPELRLRIAHGLRQQGFNAAMAIAPTPLAATWLARAGQRVCIVEPSNLAGAISRLPLQCPDWPDAVHDALRGMGVVRIGDCLRLPRQGFARRFGAGRLRQLDQALGRLPDPRVSYRTPERFVADLELPGEQSDSGFLLQACEELLGKLERFLLTRQLAVQNVRFRFFHLQAAATDLPLSCVRADRATGHWSELLALKFGRLILPAPVIAIRLSGGESQPFSAETEVLPFDKAAGRRRRSSIAHLVERLSARIGDRSVHGVTTVAEHRPQYAWCPHYSIHDKPAAAGAPRGVVPSGGLVAGRPLWILPEPAPLTTTEDHPVYRGALELLDGPERLETGWWDDRGIARDYFVAVNPQCARLWVYRDRGAAAGWYLHGIFG